MTTATATTTEQKIQIVADALALGNELNKTQFAQQHEISRSTLNAWIKKYSDEVQNHDVAANQEQAPVTAPAEKEEKEEQKEPELTADEAKALEVFKEIRENNSVLSRNGKPKQKPTKQAVRVWIQTKGDRESFVAQMEAETGKETKKCQLDWLACSHYLADKKL